MAHAIGGCWSGVLATIAGVPRRDRLSFPCNPAPPLAQRCRRRCCRSDICYGSCNADCNADCNGDCNDSCDGSCDGFFGGWCDSDCDSSCDSACYGSCDGSCDTNCNGECDSLCNSGCSACSSGEYGAAEQVTCGPRAVAQPPNTHPTPVHRAPASTPRIPAPQATYWCATAMV